MIHMLRRLEGLNSINKTGPIIRGVGPPDADQASDWPNSSLDQGQNQAKESENEIQASENNNTSCRRGGGRTFMTRKVNAKSCGLVIHSG